MRDLEPTRSKSEEEALVGVLLHQSPHPAAHPLIPLVDELLAEVAVDLLGRHLLTGRQCHVVEVGHLGFRIGWWVSDA